jgi:hypothetical protein
MNLLKTYGIRIPNGAVATSAVEAQATAKKLSKIHPFFYSG